MQNPGILPERLEKCMNVFRHMSRLRPEISTMTFRIRTGMQAVHSFGQKQLLQLFIFMPLMLAKAKVLLHGEFLNENIHI